MTAGGADQFSHSVILANAGIHRIASTVARFYRFIASVAVGFATLSPRHPHERGDLLYSEHRGLFWRSIIGVAVGFFSYCLWR
ncbi:hypothetical protein FORC54_0189 [Vibrio vulnificus]|nr:hypothetical protein FORC54_0189 [Vibrio vulnificus]PNG64423.1 hypothetical protein TI06_22970 [Vibrio vulnificus]